MNRKCQIAAVAVATTAVGMTVSLGVTIAHTAVQGPAAPTTVGAATVKVTHAVQAPRFWWQQQGASCLPMSARVVIGVETGNVVSAKDVMATAARVSGFDADGTDWATAPNILSAYGVVSHVVDSASLDDLRDSLDAGHAPIVAVDPNAIWGFFGLSGTPGEQHALVVAGIDDARHVITLVDSAWSGGMAETVPTATFLYAWDRLGDSAIVVG